MELQIFEFVETQDITSAGGRRNILRLYDFMRDRLAFEELFCYTISVGDITVTDIVSWSGNLKDGDRKVDDLLPLTPAVFHILLALADGERHGYDIMRAVESLTEGKMQMGPGTLYGSIKRMLRDGLITESDERPDPELDDSRRRYYELTAFGQQVLAAESNRLAHLVEVARQMNLLGPAQKAQEKSA